MAIGQLASTGKENNKLYRITIIDETTPAFTFQFYAKTQIKYPNELYNYLQANSKIYVSGFRLDGSSGNFIYKIEKNSSARFYIYYQANPDVMASVSYSGIEYIFCEEVN